MGQPVGRPDDEVGEGVPLVEVGRGALGRTDTRRFDAHGLGDRPGRGAGGTVRVVGLARGTDDELDLDAVADDASQRLRDQRAVAVLEPILRKSVGHRDHKLLVIDIDEDGVAQPRFEVGRRQGDLKISECRAPDLLCVHRAGSVLIETEMDSQICDGHLVHYRPPAP